MGNCICERASGTGKEPVHKVRALLLGTGPSEGNASAEAILPRYLVGPMVIEAAFQCVLDQRQQHVGIVWLTHEKLAASRSR